MRNDKLEDIILFTALGKFLRAENCESFKFCEGALNAIGGGKLHTICPCFEKILKQEMELQHRNPENDPIHLVMELEKRDGDKDIVRLVWAMYDFIRTTGNLNKFTEFYFDRLKAI